MIAKQPASRLLARLGLALCLVWTGCTESSTGTGGGAEVADAETGEDAEGFSEATLEVSLLSPQADSAGFHGALVTLEALVKLDGWPVDAGNVEGAWESY